MPSSRKPSRPSKAPGRAALAPPRRRKPEEDVALPDASARRRFRKNLLAWYGRHGRELPWRTTDDPYHILVSEVMLQQTQVDRVVPKYHEWLERFPSLESLSDADERLVSDTWRPLGYNIRPKRLQAIAREAVERFDGRLPSDQETLLSFKGIGRYTAGAIRSFAFRQRAAILDTNVARVLFRVFVATGEPKAHRTTTHLWRISETLVPRRRVFDFNQALMDLGAMVCTPRHPKCAPCPLSRSCRSAGTFDVAARPAVRSKGR
jgi:A/G-specific adenine glycosylase